MQGSSRIKNQNFYFQVGKHKSTHPFFQPKIKTKTKKKKKKKKMFVCNTREIFVKKKSCMHLRAE